MDPGVSSGVPVEERRCSRYMYSRGLGGVVVVQYVDYGL